jgi:hypothetical protein
MDINLEQKEDIQIIEYPCCNKNSCINTCTKNCISSKSENTKKIDTQNETVDGYITDIESSDFDFYNKSLFLITLNNNPLYYCDCIKEARKTINELASDYIMKLLPTYGICNTSKFENQIDITHRYHNFCYIPKVELIYTIQIKEIKKIRNKYHSAKLH